MIEFQFTIIFFFFLIINLMFDYFIIPIIYKHFTYLKKNGKILKYSDDSMLFVFVFRSLIFALLYF